MHYLVPLFAIVKADSEADASQQVFTGLQEKSPAGLGLYQDESLDILEVDPNQEFHTLKAYYPFVKPQEPPMPTSEIDFFCPHIFGLKIQGRRWFSKTAGNTYHAVRVLVTVKDLKTGMLTPKVFIEKYAYGYGNHYETTAMNLLVKAGLFPSVEGCRPSGISESYHEWCKLLSLKKAEITCDDVPRKKDLVPSWWD